LKEFDENTEIELLTYRQDLFCENIARGQKNGEAAINAGFSKSSAGPTASRLLRQDKIKKRIQEIRTTYLQSQNVDNEWIQAKYIEIIRKMDDKQPLPLIKSLIELGKSIGFYEKHNEQKHGYKPEPPTPKTNIPDEWK